jgi:hypothetical protein
VKVQARLTMSSVLPGDIRDGVGGRLPFGEESLRVARRLGPCANLDVGL